MKKVYASLLALTCAVSMSAFDFTIGDAKKAPKNPITHSVQVKDLKSSILKEYSLKNNSRAAKVATFDGEEESQWKAIGDCVFYDYLFTGLQFETPVYENVSKPGYYAIPGAWAATEEENILPLYIDCTNPDCVVIPLQNTGVSYTDAWDEETTFTSDVYIESASYDFVMAGATADFLNLYSEYNITLKDNAIFIPAKSIYVNFPDASDDLLMDDGSKFNESWTVGNNYDMMILLPGAMSEWSTVDDDAVFVDPAVFPLYGDEENATNSANVVVQKNNYFEGSYRILNPYKATLGEDDDAFPFEFDMSDTSCILVPDQYTGMYDEDWGPYFIMGISYFYIKYAGVTKEEFLANYSDYNISAIKDRKGNYVITFPKNSLGAMWPYNVVDPDAVFSPDPDNIYSFKENVNNKGSLTFNPSHVSVDIISNDNSDAPVEYFNLQGQRINNPAKGHGLFIMRQGSKATKIAR